MTISIADVLLNTHVPPGLAWWCVEIPHLAITVLHLERHGLVARLIAHAVSVAGPCVHHPIVRT
jgi:hypothetical protein